MSSAALSPTDDRSAPRRAPSLLERPRDAAPDVGGAAESSFSFLDDEGLAKLPPTRWTVDGWLPYRGFSILVGHPGAGKSFLALDLACSIASRREWHGRAVQRGPVIYVAAEGSGGLARRLAVWKGRHAVERTGVYFVPRAVPLLDAEAVNEFVDEILVRCDPALIVLDTYARCLAPGGENDDRDTCAAIQSLDYIRRAGETGVLLVHHPRREGKGPRGHSSLDGAADAILSLEDQDGTRVLSCLKMKDGVHPSLMEFRLVSVLESCLLVPTDQAGVSSSLTPAQRKVLEAIRDTDLGTGVAPAVLMDTSGVSKAQIYRVLKHLRDRDLVRKTKAGYALTAPGEAEAVSRSHPSLAAVS